MNGPFSGYTEIYVSVVGAAISRPPTRHRPGSLSLRDQPAGLLQVLGDEGALELVYAQLVMAICFLFVPSGEEFGEVQRAK